LSNKGPQWISATSEIEALVLLFNITLDRRRRPHRKCQTNVVATIISKLSLLFVGYLSLL